MYYEKNFVRKFSLFDLIFEGRAIFKGMKHMTQRKAELENVTKLFLRPRATILAI